MLTPDLLLLLQRGVMAWREGTPGPLATSQQPSAGEAQGWVVGLLPLERVRCFCSCACGLLTFRCRLLVHAACLGVLFPSPVSRTVRGPGLLRPWLSTGWSSSGPCSLLVPSLGLGTAPTVPAPHLAPLGLHTQLLLLVPSWLPGTTSLIPIPSAPMSPCWTVFSRAGCHFSCGGTQGGEGSNDGSRAAWTRALLLQLTHPGGRNPLLEKASWVRHRACLPWSQSSRYTHTSSPERVWVCTFPWFSQSGSTFGSPSRLTVSKQHKMR